MNYAAESRELDERILGVVDDWQRGEILRDETFDAIALALFDYQLRYNEPYRRYCATLDLASPRSWNDIPPVPASAFKDATLATFPIDHAALTFETSGTTAGRPGRHYFETSALYDAVLLAGFDRAMLPDAARLRYLNLVPNPAERPQSSLGYMMRRVAEQRGIEPAGWYLREGTFAFDAFVADVRAAIAAGTPVCIATTAFALAHALDRIEERDLEFALPATSRVMETGGFKGRTRIVERDELCRRTCRAFGVPQSAIVAEYGMTELTSQYYDATLLRNDGAPVDARRKFAPPWLRWRVVGPDGATLPAGTVGTLVHVDLANRASCIAISTEDLGVTIESPDGAPAGLVLIGRERGAPLRGCSLDAESLMPLSSFDYGAARLRSG